MAIRLITGIPGSGKTYFAVKHLADNYCTYDKESNEYTLKKDVTIITNIDSLILPHINLDEAIKSSGQGVAGFFTVEYQEKISRKYSSIVYLIDEAQRWFPRRNKLTSDTWYYFEYHRHLGHDVYIVTLDRKLVAENITLLVEYEIRAAKRLTSIMGELRYLVKSDGEIIDRKSIKPLKSVFNLYKSMDGKETEKIKNPLRKIAIALIIAILFCGWIFKNTFFHNGEMTLVHDADASTSDQSKSVPDVSVPESSEKLKHKTVKLSYLMYGSHLMVVCPVENRLIAASMYEYDLDVQKVGRSYHVAAQIPVDLLPGESRPDSPEKKEDSRMSGPARRR